MEIMSNKQNSDEYQVENLTFILKLAELLNIDFKELVKAVNPSEQIRLSLKFADSQMEVMHSMINGDPERLKSYLTLKEQHEKNKEVFYGNR